VSWQRETKGRQTEGNEERLGGGNEPGRCSLGFRLNGFILFFNNLEEAQQRVFMVCATRKRLRSVVGWCTNDKYGL